METQHIAQVARHGVLIDVRERPGILAASDDEVIGVLTFDAGGTDCEILTMRASGRRARWERCWSIGSSTLLAGRDVRACGW